MDSSDDAARDLFKNWKKERTKVRVLMTESPLNIILEGIVKDFDGSFLTIEGLGFTFVADLDGASFREERSLSFPVCVDVTIKAEARLIRERFGERRFLICELK